MNATMGRTQRGHWKCQGEPWDVPQEGRGEAAVPSCPSLVPQRVLTMADVLPASPQPHFPSALLRPGEEYNHTTWLLFSAA